MYTQGYRPPNQQPAAQQPTPWQYPNGYAPPAQPGAAVAPGKQKRATGGGKGGAPEGPKPRARKKHGFRWQLIRALLILVVLGAAFAGIYVWKTQADVRPYTSVFLDNVSVDGINLAGMSWEEGTNTVLKQISDKLGSWYVRLRNNAGEYKDITAQTLGINRDPTEALEQAWAVGHETNADDRKTIFELKDEIEAAKRTTHEYSSVEQSGDTSSIDSILTTLDNAAYVAPQDAAVLSFDPDNTLQPFTFQKEVVGKKLDVDA
ncbi:MAG: hypothetical protein EOM10_17735, partial [Opitutae bacterium]|nr:hypothetical protein [Opitutae bacterium]